MRWPLSLIIFAITLVSLHAEPRVLFVRGGPGTGGFLEGGADEQLADITDYSTSGGNHGWGELADWLRENNFELEQRMEGPADDNTPVPFADIDLTMVDVIVLGSNNADYETRHVDAISSWVNSGGGLLVISDANFGRNWGDAPDSDQQFLDRFGLIMNQDQGTYTLNRSASDFLVPDHPILEGVRSFDGEGVSPIMISEEGVPNVRTTILARARGNTRVNNRYTQGSSRQTSEADGSLVIAEAGTGRVVGHFDRNTFFNKNGAGTDLHRFDNRTYALNLFRWLGFGDAGLQVRIESPTMTDFSLRSSDDEIEFQATAYLFESKLGIFDPARYLWSLVEGPGAASFSKETAPLTSVSFPTEGTYRIKVVAEHRDRVAEQVVEVTVSFGRSRLIGQIEWISKAGSPMVLITSPKIKEMGLAHTLERSNDLQNWSASDALPEIMEDGSVRFHAPGSANASFFRVRVE